MGGVNHRLRGTLPGERTSSMSDPDSVWLPSVGPLTRQMPAGHLHRDRSDT
jgi:hypothetical protein